MRINKPRREECSRVELGETNSRKSFKSVLLVLLVGLAISSMGWAAANRVYLSPQKGSDANTCTLAKPCRQFAKALTEVSAGGDIIVLDSGAFTAFQIGKSVSIIVPDGVLAEVIATSGSVIRLFTAPGDTVVIHGLTMKSFGFGADEAILMEEGTLHVENSIVDGTSLGINVEGGSPSIFLKDTILRNNFNGANFSTFTAATVDHCRFEHNATSGLTVLEGKVSVRDSVFSGNGTGINFQRSGEVNIDNCLVANNNVGVYVIEASSGLAPIARISNSTITDNQIGLQQSGLGTILSRGNNTLEGNTTQIVGAIGTYTPQ